MSEKQIEPPFPWLAMSSICLGMLAHSVVFTSPLPFVAFMVVDFGMAESVDGAGYSAGWITGAFMIGRTVAGIPWGIASDKWGRKPCLILSMVNVAIIGLMFGFSSSFPMAVSLRFLMGLGNGFMCVAKTCVSEIVTTKEHEMRAFGYLNSIWGLGLIVGPALGGMLSRGAIQYPTIFGEHSIWGRYPYLLPCLVCASIAVAAGISIALFLPETLGNNTLLVDSKHQIETDATANINEEETSTVTDIDSVNSSSKSFSIDTHDDDDDEERGIEMMETSKQQITNNPLNKIKWSITPSDSSTTNGIAQHRTVHFQRLSSQDQDIEEGGSLGSSHHHHSGVENEEEEEEEEGEENHDHNHSHVKGIRHSNDKSGGSVLSKAMSLLHSSSKVPGQTDSTTYKPVSGAMDDSVHNSSDQTSLDSHSSNSITSKTLPLRKPSSMSEITSDKDIQLLFGIYMTFCFVIMFVDESFPLWAVTSIQKGGLAWDSAQVGGVLACIGLGLVVYQIFFYEPVMRKFFYHGTADTYFKLCLISGVSVSLVPVVAGIAFACLKTTTPEGSRDNYFAYCGVILFLMIYRTSAGSAFTTLGIVVNSSVDQSMRGTMNGLVMTAGSLGNGAGPIVGSICYAVSLTLPQVFAPIPLDGRIVFVLGGIMAVCLGCFAKRTMRADN